MKGVTDETVIPFVIKRINIKTGKEFFMYDENMLIDLEGEDYGERVIRTVSEPDSYFPRSLTLYDDIVSANIVATDDYGDRPAEYEISVPALGYAFIHAPYNIEISGGGTMIIYNPPRLLRLGLKNGDIHYFPFSGAEGKDAKTEYEKEIADLFDDKYKDIKILREAAKVMKLMEGLDDEEAGLNPEEYPEESFRNYFEQMPKTIELVDYFKEKCDYEDGEDIQELEEEGETKLRSFTNAMKWLGERNRECFDLRLQNFYRYTSEDN